MSDGLKRLLIVEDVDHKFNEVFEVLKSSVPSEFEHARAKTVIEATDQIESQRWDLIVLDISMDIAPGSGGVSREGHANLGGLDVIEHMFLLAAESPTVILTGFDYFVRSSAEVEINEAQTILDLERQARTLIGSKLVGCIRYGARGWDDQLKKIARSLK